MFGPFDKMFDFNSDGKLDSFERACEFQFMDSLSGADSSDVCSYDENESFDLEMAGLSRDELEFMDEDERREVLEDAGLDPDDFDFD